MTTTRIRSRVSLVAALAFALTLGACASAGPASHAEPLAAREGAPAPATIRFANEATYYVRVYLVGERRQWLLGRVEGGSVSSLRIPGDAMAEEIPRMRIAVLPGQLGLVNPASAARVTTFMQPLEQLLTKKWAFTPTIGGAQLNSLPLAIQE